MYKIKSFGFTIIELLIVIVIIGILATLVAVSYTGISNLTRKTTLNVNASGILRSLKVYLVNNENFDPLTLDEHSLTPTLKLSSNGYETLAMYNQSGEHYIYIVGNGTFSGLIACGVQGNINVYEDDNAACVFGESDNVVAAVTDVNPGVLGGGNGSTCALAKTIDSVEDLVVLATSTNSGTTYSGQCIKLTTDLDFDQKKSYKNPNAKTYQDINNNTQPFGDINGNSIIEGIKTELTTGAGFIPIGNGTNKFSGNFLGENHTIYGLMVNRPTTNYNGLFGYISAGSTSVLDLVNVDIVGGDYTGGLIGYSYNGSATESYVEGNVTGGNYTGLINGYYYNRYSRTRLSSVIAEGTVAGANYVGGISGFLYSYSTTSGIVSGIFKGGSVVSTGASVGRVIGGINNNSGIGGAATIYSAIALSSTTVNDKTQNNSLITSINGADYDYDSELNNVNLVENALDTYINGDDDNNGYYWDYDISGNVVRKKTTDAPLTFNLSGSGTDVNPYLISSYDDLRQASQKLSSVYKLNEDINLSDERYYVIGSFQHKFSGKIIGNDKKISNLTINCPSCTHTGFTGYNKGSIDNIDLVNVDIVGGDYTGGLIGYSYNGSATESYVEGNVTGGNYTGLINGYYNNNYSRTRLSSVIAEGTVAGANYVGGISGFLYSYSTTSGIVSGIFKGGSVVSTGASVGRVIGGINNNSGIGGTATIYSAIALSSTTVNDVTIDDNYPTSINGADYDYDSELNNVNLVENALDTYINGDDDNNGYYWDYDISGNVVRKKTTDAPLTFNLSGSGTDVNPYLISSYDDLRQASQKLSSVYKITTDINLSGQRHYMLGSYINRFRGTLLGDNKTISNLNINCTSCSYVGLIGVNEGTVASLNMDNPTISAGSYVGGIAGYNRGTIKGLKQNSINLTGKNYLGGLAGYSMNGYITDSIVTGNIVGVSYLGLSTGFFGTDMGTNISQSSIMVNGNITGENYIGGLTGYIFERSAPAGNLNAVNGGGAIITTGSSLGRLVGHFEEMTYGGYVKFIKNFSSVSSVTLNGSTVTSIDPTSKNGKDINLLDLSNPVTYTDLGFNFDDEALDYIWYINGASATFREGSL